MDPIAHIEWPSGRAPAYSELLVSLAREAGMTVTTTEETAMNAAKPITRPYRSNDHLWSTVKTDAGTLAVLPTSARTLYFDAAKASHIPAYRDEGEHGSTVLDIGRGARVRVSGHAEKVGACWEIGRLYVTRDTGGDATRAMEARAEALVFEMVNEWAQSRAGDIAQADDIDRNNAARTLEENIARHEHALSVLREQLRACEEGEPFLQYPELATKR